MAKTAFGAKRGQSTLAMDPNDLVIIDDSGHPLYDERELLALDDQMVKNIMAIGVINPVTVAKSKEGQPIVIAGRRRVAHAREANRRLIEAGQQPKPIPVLAKRTSDVPMLFALSISENEHRLDDSPMNRARKAARLLDMGYDEESAAVIFACTPQTIRNWLSLLDCSAKVKRAVESGRIGATAASKLAKLSAEEQDAALAELSAEAATGKRPTTKKAEAKAAAKRGKKIHRMRSRKEIESRLETPKLHPVYRSALLWVLGIDDSEAADTTPKSKKS
jgi:ParB family chromosome partitioning protein